MKESIFYHYSGKNNLTIDKIKFIKPIITFNRPLSGLWLAKKKSRWNKFITYRDNKIYTYKVVINLDDVYMLTPENLKMFHKTYNAAINISNPKDLNYKIKIFQIDWAKFVKNNPTCKGIYLTFNPNSTYKSHKKKISQTSKNDFEHIVFAKLWYDKSLCIWNKNNIIDFKLVE